MNTTGNASQILTTTLIIRYKMTNTTGNTSQLLTTTLTIQYKTMKIIGKTSQILTTTLFIQYNQNEERHESHQTSLLASSARFS
jgi:hypothetical protein